MLASDTNILDVFSGMERIRQNYELYFRAEPSLDGALADLLAPKGYKRYSYQQEMFGIPYLGHQLSINTDNKFIESLGLFAGQYVTFHDGWDDSFKTSPSRPTKAIPSKLWSELVVALKSKFPALKIVQIGGKTGDDIPEADFNFKNKLTFGESTSVLACARLHFDGESGLVHLAASLGVRSVVMFGPTSKEWFGYPENINVTSGQCGNCWWSTDIWMSKCPVGYKIPICTESFNVQAVVKQVMDELNREVKLDSIELQG